MNKKFSQKGILNKRTESIKENSESKLNIRPQHTQTPEPISMKKTHSRDSSVVIKRISSISNKPGYSFSKNSRFENDIYERFKNLTPIFTKNSVKFRKSVEVIQKPKIKLTTPKEKLENLKKFSDHERIKEEVSRIARSNIISQMKIIKERKISEKFSRYYLRKNHKIVFRIKFSFITLYTAISAAYVIRRLIQNKNRLKIRSYRKILWLLGVTKVFGRLKMKLKKIRRILALRKISRNVSRIRKWVKRNRMKHATQIIDFFENYIDKDTISSVMFLWKIKILFIQRSLSYLLRQRRRLYTHLLGCWNYIEKEILQARLAKKQKKSIKKHVFPNQYTIASFVPDRIKLNLIRAKIQYILKTYITNLNSYFELASKEESPTLHEVHFFTSKPKPPNLRKEFSSDILRVMIEKSLKDNERLKIKNQKNFQ